MPAVLMWHERLIEDIADGGRATSPLRSYSRRCRLAPARVRADALPAVRGHRTRRRNRPITPAATSARSAGTPVSFTRPNKTSRTIAIRNARTWLSTPAAATDQIGRLFTALPRAYPDLGYLALRRSIPRPALILLGGDTSRFFARRRKSRLIHDSRPRRENAME